MNSRFIESPISPRWLLSPAWWAVINLLVTLYGIVFLQWSLRPIVFIFWIELILAVAAALVRVLTALGGRPYWAALPERLFALVAGGILGVAMIMLGVTFTIGAFRGETDARGFGSVRWQVWILAFNALAALITHYFVNNRFRSASPVGEMMRTLIYLLVLLVLIMVSTQHFLPRFPDADQAFWIGLAVIAIKFVVDMLFTRLRSPLERLFTAE